MSQSTTAAEAASSAGSASSGALNAGSGVAGTYGAMADLGGNTSSVAGPTVGNAMSTYGTVAEAPSWMDKTMDFLNRYQKGENSNVLDAYKGMGMNAETAGYVGGKVKGMFSGGGNQPASPININSSYQQPEDPYLMRRYMLKAGRR